ncbi:hypothetical protein Tdes44962_MAKER06184 [Teratosphaeria destructans]|uniref:Lytic polysaccharide monooxygenase n=1 Tax=Teratosphaeria destructans TaxID=418781 RepID=A0A9W7VY68_9PEZI|nr:hypothetical protein Tdes44962_MAKER06184 [Teratosphaeria destructans]
MRASLIAAGLGLKLATAHLFISSPTPIEGTAIKSPLDASGSNFPCHGVTLPTTGGTAMSAGCTQLLAFDNGDGANTAVHGGGSCQISITYETDASKLKDPKNWFVIYSIEGGCPSNTHQNLDGTYQGPEGSYTGALQCSDPKSNGVDCINSFNFTIPKGVRDGHAIMSWTWFNTVGNREIYQNCINADLTGGDGSEMEEFPTMFVANLESVDTCPTTQSVDLQFPFAGKYVTTKKPSGEAAKTAVTFPMSTPSGAGCATDGAAASGAAATTSAGNGSSATASASGYAVASAAQTSSVSQQTAAANSGGAIVTVTTMATITGSASSAAVTPAIVASGSSAASDSATETTGSSDSSGNSTSSSSYSTGTCSSDGAVVCNGESQFGICNAGSVVWQDVAAGTTCSGGSITKKRHVRKHVAGRISF